jgi:hypothetical protein
MEPVLNKQFVERRIFLSKFSVGNKSFFMVISYAMRIISPAHSA